MSDLAKWKEAFSQFKIKDRYSQQEIFVYEPGNKYIIMYYMPRCKNLNLLGEREQI